MWLSAVYETPGRAGPSPQPSESVSESRARERGGRPASLMAAGDGAPLPGTMVPASRNVEKALEEAAASGALHLANRKLKEFPKSAKNYDLSDITHAGWLYFIVFPAQRPRSAG